MIPPNQQLVIVPERCEIQRADDGNLLLLGRDDGTGLIVAFVLGPKVAQELGEGLLAPNVNVVRHLRDVTLPPAPGDAS